MRGRASSLIVPLRDEALPGAVENNVISLAHSIHEGVQEGMMGGDEAVGLA
jgi:hypothetical protein